MTPDGQCPTSGHRYVYTENAGDPFVPRERVCARCDQRDAFIVGRPARWINVRLGKTETEPAV